MAYDGYYMLDGTEIINVARTEAYAGDLSWFRPVYQPTDLRVVLEDPTYTDPATDDAPWYDPFYPESADFLGVYPLDVTGVSDSTQTGTIVESLGRGGVVAGARQGTKTAVFNAALLARSEAGVEHGLQWLKRALEGASCGSSAGCRGHDLCYFSAEPRLMPSESCGEGAVAVVRTVDQVVQRYMRTLRHVHVTVGVQTTSKRPTTDGGAVRTVQFTLTATDPLEVGLERAFLNRWLDPAVTNPWPGGVAPAGASVVGTAYDAEDDECLPAAYAPLADPLAPAVIAPPTPPGIEWSSFSPPTTWKRRRVVLPDDLVSLWMDTALVLRVTAPGLEVRNARVRVWADPSGSGNVPDDGCDFCSDVVIAYLPADGTMTVDPTSHLVYVDTTGGVRRRADSLVSDTYGGPIEFPSLTCNMQYVITLDVPAGSPVPYLSLSLVETF